MNLDLQVFLNLFVSIAEEMGIVLRRTAFSANIKERRDYSCAVYDADGRTVAMGDHMPAHLGAMPVSVSAVLQEAQPGRGDIYFLNDPFRGGTHLPDITSVSAVFPSGCDAPALYLATRAHHADVGGMMPGSMPLATEIFQEGLRIPPIRLVRDGEYDEGLLALILANVRTPQERRGDLGAQVAAHRVGERRLLQALAKHGPAKIAERTAQLQDYAERLMRRRLAALPDGSYDFEDCLDNDGFSTRPVRIACRLTVSGESATVDFSESDPQTRGGVNANRAVTDSAVMYCFRCLIADDTPYNAGLMRPVTVVTRAGTVCAARLPASVAAGNVETSQRIADVVMGALQQADPASVPAASSGTMNNVSLGGIDPLSGAPFAYYETIAGGMGARPTADGLDAVHTNMTNSLNTPIEALEHQYPLRVTRYSKRPGSGGTGKHRGGHGVIREIEFLAGAEVTLLSERRERRPYGVAGGGPGKPGRNTLNGSVVAAKGSFQVKPGDRMKIETPGGGGYFSSKK